MNVENENLFLPRNKRGKILDMSLVSSFLGTGIGRDSSISFNTGGWD